MSDDILTLLDLLREVDDAAGLRRVAEFAAARADRLDGNGKPLNAREAAWRALPQVGTFTIGQTMHPTYLRGKTIPVRKVNSTTYGVEFPNTPEFSTWAGRWGCRIGKSAGTFTPTAKGA